MIPAAVPTLFQVKAMAYPDENDNKAPAFCAYGRFSNGWPLETSEMYGDYERIMGSPYSGIHEGVIEIFPYHSR